ncbi:hypothetical protein [uncultured Novosphingobium sp.]|uniref:hypothetical protein n=1 Tax=Novosphingobium fluoreni TaxID=1391222 RepID=UPI000736F7C9|nr:hypothetical protein NS277_16500 [Novosphingobium barchaimii]
MAFVNFADAAPAALPIAHSAIFAMRRPEAVEPYVALPQVAPLDALERRVIELARGDGMETLKPRRKRSWLARLILGPQAPSPVLANERLEALRRLAVQAWHHGYTLPASALHEARKAGWDERQIGAVIDMIGRLQPPVRRLAA